MPSWVVQVLQVLTILLVSPLLAGFIAKVEARLQGRKGPRVLQPFYDLWKLFGKETLATQGASAVFFIGPILAFACYLIVPMLIPVLTTFPLPFGYIGDILGGGMLLGLAGFMIAWAGADTSSPYAEIGSSRAMTFGSLAEPILLFVVLTVGVITSTDLPYAMSAAIRKSAGAVLEPAHVLAAVAFFLLVLSDTGRIPVESPSGTIELGMIDEGRVFEHSGPLLALIRWGSYMKQMILYTILLDVFVAPWGLSSSRDAGSVFLAIGALAGKAALVGVVFAVIDDSFAKLRLFKITEFLVAAFLIAVLGLLVFFMGAL